MAQPRSAASRRLAMDIAVAPGLSQAVLGQLRAQNLAIRAFQGVFADYAACLQRSRELQVGCFHHRRAPASELECLQLLAAWFSPRRRRRPQLPLHAPLPVAPLPHSLPSSSSLQVRNGQLDKEAGELRSENEELHRVVEESKRGAVRSEEVRLGGRTHTLGPHAGPRFPSLACCTGR